LVAFSFGKPASTFPENALGLCRIVRFLLALLLGALLVATTASAGAEDAEITTRRAAERKTFSDADIALGFFKTVFGAELRLRGRTDVIRKYDGPVRVFIENRAKPDRRADVARVIDDIRRRVDHLDIAVTEDRAAANYFVTLIRDRDLVRTVRTMYGRDKAKRIARLDPQCLSGFRKDDSFRIVQSNVLLVADAGDFIFYDCAYEELLQALGPINDTDVPWTMFNDDVQMGFFDVYDQYILNILYDPRIRPGMPIEQVRALFPEVLPTVRAWVAKLNNLPP
jgi:Protein of unknown function (DUF2927)